VFRMMLSSYLPWVNLIWLNYYRNRRIPGEKRGSFWWRSMLILLTTYKGLSQATFGVGDTILFWSDLWYGKIL
jgi:hypothetical protein